MHKRNRIIYILLILFTIITHAHGNSSGDACLKRIPNINNALTGFDPLYSNPFENPDPGAKSQIFEPYEVKDGCVKKNAFLALAEKYLHCNSDSSESTIKNYAKYREMKKSSYTFTSDTSADVSVGGAFFSFSSSFGYGATESTNELDVRNFFQNGTGELVESTAECITHKIKLSSFEKPVFTTAFITALRSLHKAATGYFNDAKSENVFVKFADDYGTHYMKTIYLGSKLILQSRFSSFSKSQQQEKERQDCVGRSVRGRVGATYKGVSAGVSQSSSSEKCAASDSSKSSGQENSIATETIITVGNEPTSDLGEWAESVTNNPVPIQIELESILSIFEGDWLSSIAVDPFSSKFEQLNASAIHAYFKNKTANYCKLRTSQTKCEFKMVGCGLNSNCPSNTKCVNDANEPNGYKCQQKYGKICFIYGDRWIKNPSNFQQSFNSIKLS